MVELASKEIFGSTKLSQKKFWALLVLSREERIALLVLFSRLNRVSGLPLILESGSTSLTECNASIRTETAYKTENYEVLQNKTEVFSRPLACYILKEFTNSNSKEQLHKIEENAMIVSFASLYTIHLDKLHQL